MKYHIIFVALITVILFPSTTHAAVVLTTAAPAVAQNGSAETKASPTAATTQGLFTISFTLKAFGSDIIVPTHTERNYHATTTDDATGILYNIYNRKGTRIMSGTSLAFIHSSGVKTDGGYKIRKNTSRKFTVVGVYDNKGGVPDSYHLRIDGIRYFLRNSKGTAILETNGLRTYNTDGITLTK